MALRDRITVRMKDGREFPIEATRSGGDVVKTRPTVARGTTDPQLIVVEELTSSPSKPPIRRLEVLESEVAAVLEERDRPPEPKTSGAGAAKRSRKPKSEPVEA